MNRMNKTFIGLAILGCAMGFTSGVSAQEVVYSDDTIPAPEVVADTAPEEDVTNLSLTAGALLTAGNTQSLQLNAGAHFELIRGSFGFLADVAYVVGLGGDEFGSETANNLNARIRGDYFITPNDAIFLAAALRRDTFAALDPRIQIQVGYLHNFINEEDHRLWGEAGYDLTLDFYNYDTVDLTTPAPIPDTRLNDDVIHSLRLFVGYHNGLGESLDYRMGLEGLIPVYSSNGGNIGDGAFRLNWDNTLAASIAGNLQAEFKFGLYYNSCPPGFAANDVCGPTETEAVDIVTSLNLVYTLL